MKEKDWLSFAYFCILRGPTKALGEIPRSAYAGNTKKIEEVVENVNQLIIQQ